MNIVDKIIKSKNSAIYLITAKEQGKDCWFYVKVNKIKQPLLEAALKIGEFSVTDYGQVLYSGWGAEPDSEVAALVDAMLEK